MYLKKLEIQGFKSFAEKTSVLFNDGITSVVGPNGSGKSNISDSIRWVLGEQSAKSLRGGKMEDVIFSGTEHRKALGFAEVSLTIDNDSKLLPLDFSEVTITRRVYRSGEGEYLINKTPCRLKDIHELFMDTGIGRDGYSIIGQGRVDEILSSRSEDRRAIFEEASGIMKYKTRKQEAERKLDQTENNLLRINDIVAELDGQIGPLEKQAEIARKYLTLREQLKDLEVSVFLENIGKAKEKIFEADGNLKIVEANIEKENLNLTTKTEETSESTAKLKVIEEELEVLTKEYYEYETSLERANSEININKEKISAASNNIGRLSQERELLQNKSGDINVEIKEKEDRLKEYSNKLDKDYITLAEVTAKYDALVSDLDDSEKKVEVYNRSLVSKLGEQTDLKLRIAQSKNVVDNLNERNYNINTEITQVELQKIDILHEKKEVEKALEDIRAQIEFQKDRIKTLNQENIELKQKHVLLEKHLNNVKNDIHLKDSRKRMLLSMEANLEGYYKSVRELLKECDRNPTFANGIHGALVKLIEVSGKHATAIEMTMAGALQNVVTSSEEDAKRAIEYLKRNRLGRATFLPISSVKGRRLEDRTLNEASKMPGFVGLACDLVKYDSKYEGIILNLLGKVVVAEDLDSGIAIARKFSYGFRIVTLDGDVLSTSGSMAGGSNDNKDGGILNRAAEIGEITKEVEKLKGEEVLVGNNLNDILNMLKEVSSEIAQIEVVARDSEHARIREESHFAQTKLELQKIEDRLNSLNSEKDNFSQVLTEANTKHSSATLEIDKIEKELEEIKNFISSHQNKHKEEQQGREKYLHEITDLKVNIGALKETIENYRQMLQRFLTETDSITQSNAIKNDEIRNTKVEIERINKINTATLEKIEETEKLKKAKGILLEAKTKSKKELDEKSYKVVTMLQEINNNLLLLNEEQGRLNVKRTKLDSELESIQNRLWDEYELTYNNALPLKKEIENMGQAQRLINEFRNSIKNLGPVNVTSIEEYIKTKERFDFLTVQKADLDNAKDKLRLVIVDLTDIMKKQFVEQFKIINENFNVVFKDLFSGGRADLILTDKDNVLESGIEIEVQPPGKKLQNMMLLSGGERAFTAIALLFSILKMRPAPFCLLDEIEAALDDANVYKFAQYIRKHTHLTQFLVITHRKGTMESSDSLYGVTMQEAGVSNILSLKLGDKFANLN